MRITASQEQQYNDDFYRPYFSYPEHCLRCDRAAMLARLDDPADYYFERRRLFRAGTVSSTRRVKEAIGDMGDSSIGLLRLRPVTFCYKQPMADGSKPLQYGLIAEEVAEVMPEIVIYDADGQPQTVQYHVLPALLLNELQRQEKELATLRAQASEVAELRQLPAAQQAELANLKAALLERQERAAR